VRRNVILSIAPSGVKQIHQREYEQVFSASALEGNARNPPSSLACRAASQDYADVIDVEGTEVDNRIPVTVRVHA
jgi:hypothetical protein